MGSWGEIKSFLLPTRIGTSCLFNTHVFEFYNLSWDVEFLDGMSDFNRIELELWASIGLFFF